MRLLIVDDHEVVRRGVRSLLLEQSEFEVCGEAVDGQDALEQAREVKPDLIVMDLSMPKLNGLEATRQVRSMLPDCEVLILSQHENPEMARQALKAGARGYVVKNSVSKDLIAALTKISRREYFFDPAILEQTSSAHIDIQEILQRSAAFEQALRQSEELYRSTFELAAVGVAHVSPEGKWLRVNKKLCDIVGYSEPELLNLSFHDITHSGDLVPEIAQWEKVRNGTLDTYSMEKRYIRKDGSYVWVNRTVSGVRDASGKLQHFISVVEDISARKSAESALRESEERLQLAQQVANVGTFEWNIKTGVNRWTPELERLYGLPPGGFKGTQDAWERLVHPEDREEVVRAVERTLKDKKGAFEAQWRVTSPDGSVRWLLGRAYVVRDQAGTPARFIGVNVDITERKRMEEKLRHSEERMRFSLEAASIGTWEWDVRKGQVTWSSNMESVHGQPPGSFSGSFDSFLQGVFVEDREKVMQEIKLALSGEGKYKVEYRQHRSDGSLGWMEANGRVVFDADGQPLRMFGVCASVTDRKSREQALRGSEERFRAIVETTPECVKLVARDGTLLHMNSSGLQMVGAECAEAVVGKSVYDLIAPEDRERFRAFNEKVCAEEKGSLEFDIVRFDGKSRHMETHAAPFRNPNGSIVQLAVTRDITQGKEAEQATGLLAAIVASSDDAIVSKNLDGIISSWNKGAERMFGYTAEEAVGQHITLIVPTERRAEEADILDRLRRGERVDHFHAVRRRKDGTLLDVSLTISPVRDSSGRVIGASKVARDITAQKQAERALRESEQRFRVITDASPIMVWMSGTDKLCYYFNKGWLDFVGRTLEQERGNGWAENVHPVDFDRCLQIYVSSFDARRPFEMEYRLRHHTGQYRWILDRAVPRYTPDGTFEGYVGGCLDIHDQKEAAEKVRIADETLRLMKVQDEERRRIARELHDSAGQTLTVLGLALAQLVYRAEVIAPELAKEGKEIEGVVQQLHREIRTTSYLLHPPLLDECGLASAVNWYVEGLGQRSGIAINLDIAENLGRLPSDVELAIFRLVQECLTNIHRHSGSKAASIRIFVDAESLHAEVSDQGKGIAPERLAEIRSGGSGVGIKGMQERLRQFGGTMTVESNGAGTRVVASLPIPKKVRSADNEPLQAAV
jgi:PAS domain S-box-containing protein